MASESSPRIEFLYWSGCPSWEQALRELREELSAIGLDPGGVEVRAVETDEAARQEGFPGSPTIRIAGVDFDPPAEQPTGLTCRIYRLADGRVSALPDRGRLRDALARSQGAN